jgi:hypothetical protein
LDPSTHAIDLVDRQLAAYNRRDLEAFAACYTDDVELWTGSGQLIARGQTAFREHYRRLFETNPTLRGRLVGRQVQGSIVVDHEHLTGRVGREPFFAFAVFEATPAGIRRVWFHYAEMAEPVR